MTTKNSGNESGHFSQTNKKADKQKSRQKEFILIENDEVITKEKEVAEKINNFFIETIEDLDITSFPLTNENTINPKNKIEKNMKCTLALKMYCNEMYPSILKIKEYITIEDKFSFTLTTQEEFQKEIKQLDTKKAIVENVIPTKMRRCLELFNKYLQ